MRNLIIFGIVCAFLGAAMFLGHKSGSDVPKKSKASSSSQGAIPSIGRIQILNGCGTPGMSWIAADELRASGFDVKNDGIGNADFYNYQSTLIIARTQDMSIARQVGVAMALDPDNVFLFRTSDDRFDVTVILGADYQRKSR